MIKLTDHSSQKLREAVNAAAEEHGDAWYEFAEETWDAAGNTLRRAIIFVPDKKLPLTEETLEQLNEPQGSPC